MQYKLDRIILNKTKVAPKRIRLFKLGLNKTTKGEFYLTKDNGNKIIDSWKEYGNKLSFDYNHAQLNELASPESQISAGTFDLELNDLGLFAVNIEWTEKAKQLIESKEYIYTSPAFLSKIEKADNKKYIVDIINCALTNIPATHELTQLLEAASKRIFDKKEKLNMENTEELKCGDEEEKLQDPIQEEAPMEEEKDPMEVLKELIERVSILEQEVESLKPSEKEPAEEEVVIEEEKTSKELEALKEENKQLKLAIELKEKEELVTIALSEKKLFPAQKELYMSLNKDVLKEELSKLQPISLGRVVPQEIKQEKSESVKLAEKIVEKFNKQFK